MNPRIQQLISQLGKHRLDAFLITSDVNIRYLTDFPSSESWLFICPKRAFYITDPRYALEARQSLKAIGVKVYRRSLGESLWELASVMGAQRIGFDDRHLFLSAFKLLKKATPKARKLVCSPGLVEAFREIKSHFEIDQIKKALGLHKQAYQFLQKTIRPGITEKDCLKELEGFVRSQDGAFSFPAIIASGPNSCFPHAQVTDRMIKRNEPVLVDMGIDLDGYKSDLTRMIFLGTIPRFIREVHDTVRRAQALAIQKVRPGVLACDLDAAARNYLTQNHLGKFFGHSLGHGVGLEIHEAPRISQRNPSPLKEGMVFTIEPAVYIPHQFGIRIEDMVLVTQKGCEVLSGPIH